MSQRRASRKHQGAGRRSPLLLKRTSPGPRSFKWSGKGGAKPPFSTHILGEAEAICYWMVKDHGEMVALGSPGELVKRLGGLRCFAGVFVCPHKTGHQPAKSFSKEKTCGRKRPPNAFAIPVPQASTGALIAVVMSFSLALVREHRRVHCLFSDLTMLLGSLGRALALTHAFVRLRLGKSHQSGQKLLPPGLTRDPPPLCEGILS